MENDLLLRTIAGKPVSRTPAWIMRQAGRYLPEYRKVRGSVKDFLALCHNPSLAAEVTLQPIQRFPLDAAIIFSDILIIPDAMGLELKFVENEGPVFLKPVASPRDIIELPIPDPSNEMRFVLEAIKNVKSELNNRIPLIGFCGSPWTLATYMLEGRGSRDFTASKRWLYDEPALLNQLLAKLSESCYQLLAAQIEAGVDVVMIFDTWGGILSPANYQLFSLHYLQRIVAALKNNPRTKTIPVILFSKNCAGQIDAIADSGCDVVGVDWTADLTAVRNKVGDRVAIQGNLDPGVLLAKEAAIEQAVAATLAAYGSGSGHIFNLGHGITPDVNPEKVAFLLDRVNKLSQQYHQANGG